MAKSNYSNYSLHALGLLGLVLCMHKVDATTFTVGGSKGWSVPSDNSPVFNQWAERMRFQIGDSLLFVYAPASDSVLRVKKEDFTSCTTSSPLEKFTDGHTVYKFNQSGPHYFISGNKDNCLKNEKIVVVVMADRNKKTAAPVQSPPAPQPSTAPPAPVPAADQPAASPPSTVAEFTPAPSDESDHPRSGAASFVMSFVGSVGAFVGSSLLLAF